MRYRVVHLRSKGFTLVEAAFSTSIVAILIVSALHVIGAAARAQRLQRDRSRAQALARDLMAEIVQLSYEDPEVGGGTLGTDAGETGRSTYDDVDDYRNFVETTIRDRNGAVISGYTGWKRNVTVSWADPANILNLGLLDSGLKKITVTVTDSGGQTVSLAALRSLSGAAENVPASPVTYTSKITVTIGAGADLSAQVSAGASTVNQIPD